MKSRSVVRVARIVVWLCALLAVTAMGAPGKSIRLRNETITPAAPVANSLRSAVSAANDGPTNGLFLIQFETIPTPRDRQQLSDLGVDLLTYVPDGAFVARFDQTHPNRLRALPFVRWVGPFKPKHKFHGNLPTTAALKGKPQGNIEVSVLLAPRAKSNAAAGARSHFARLHGEKELAQGTILRGTIAPNRLQQLAASPAVLWIEPTPRMKLQDEIATKIVAGDDANAGTFATVHQLGYTGAGVTVAVADSGLDSGDTNSMHPDLAGRVSGLFHYGALTDAADEHSHGTHCAGIVAGNATTGEVDDNGFRYGLGVAPGASILAQRIFDGAGGYTYTNATFEKLTRDAKLAGADIGSNSWGDDTQGRYDLSAMEFDALVRDAVSDTFAAGDQPYILEFSAGNAGPGERTIGSPAVAKNVIATGACQNDRPDLLIYGDGPDAMADFSSRGPCEDGRIKPDVTAPGTWIASLRSVYADDNNAWGEISPNYMYQGGTSQAGPHAAGAAAVFVQYWRQTHTNATPSPALVKAALINSATDMDEAGISSIVLDENGDPIDVGFPQVANPVPNNDEGWGRVDLPKLIGSTKNYAFMDQSVLLTNNQQFEQRILIAGAGEPLKITLTYTDVPGTPLTIPALVNDLDLEVLAPDGHIYHGNQFNAGESIPDVTAFDTINNVEAVHLVAPVAGEYIVRIRARNVVMDARRDTPSVVDQDFALVVSGSFTAPGTGIVTFDRRVYTAPSTINLRLVDYDLAGQATASLLLRSTVETNGESITLHAFGSTGLFTGAVATATGPVLADGKLQVQHSNTITAIYQDTSPAAQRLFTARADLQPPVISGVFTTNRFGKAQVKWDTDEPASSRMFYGTTPALGSVVTNSLLVTNHTAIANGQVPGQTNYFILVCADEAGNLTTNSDGGLLFKYVVPFVPPVLVVDAYFADLIDPPPPIENYTGTLDALGLGYDVWDVESQGSPTAADLKAYRVVLWRIAEYSTAAATGLTSAQQAALRDYLDSGGALFIASMELISRLGLTSPFVHDVLHITDFTEDVAVTAVEGVPNDAIGNGLAMDLDYTDYTYGGFFELNYSDTITPGNGAEGILTDTESGEFTGLRFPRIGVDSPGRSIFLSFPLDAMPFGDRTTFLRRTLQFLAPGLNGQGSVAFNQSAYAVPSEATVEVADSNLEGIGQINININSDTQTNNVPLNLQETLRRGVFRGTFALVQTNTGGALTELRANPGDFVRARYFDASSNLTITASVPVENTPPDITGVNVETNYVDAVIYWDTDELADSQVEFGESTLLGRTALDTTPTDFHAVALPQLEPARTYYFRVVSKDRAGNITVDDNDGDFYTFTTLTPLHPPWTNDMEHGTAGWTVYTVDESEPGWELGPPGTTLFPFPAHSPSNAWGSNLNGDYASQIESYLISPAIQLTGGNTAKLKFWHAYDFTSQSEYDIYQAGELLLLTDDALEPISLGVWSDDVVDWEPVEVDLTPHIGKIVYLAWHYFLFSLDAAPRTGWLVDDVSITVTNVSAGTVQITNNLWQAFYTLTGPTNRAAGGRSEIITNAPTGQYIIQYAALPYYQTPPSQTNTLTSGGTVTFTGNYTFADANANGIPDPWESENFAGVSPQRTQSTDTDGDGLSDWAEFVAGTDPNNPPPPFQLTAQRLGNNLVKLSWPSVTNHTYRVHASSNAVTWLPQSAWFGATGTNTSITFSTATNGAVKFFRVEAAPPATSVAATFRISATLLPNKQVRLEWPSASGHGYRILGSANGASWLPFTDWIRASGFTTGFTLPVATNGTPTMYRVEAKP